MPNRTARTTLVISAAMLATLAGACGGRGRYTQDHYNAAEHKVSVLKAGTEWQMAHQAFLAGDLDKALRKVDASIGVNDAVPKSHVLRGRILLEMGDLGPAMQSLYTAETLDPNNADAQYYLGIVNERLLEPEKAAEHFMKASELDGHNPQYAVAAAEMLIDMGEIDRARSYLNDGPMFEHDPAVQQTLGHIAMIQHDVPTAVTRFREASLLAPEHDAILEDLIRAQVASGAFADAERNISKLLENPEHAGRRDLLHMHARCLVNLDEPVTARGVYQKLTEGNEGRSDADAWSGLGNVAFMIGDDRNARKAASRLVAIAPADPAGYQLWSLILRAEEQFDQALSHADKAVTLDPDDPSLHALRGLVLRDLGRNREAGLAFTNAVAIEPENPTYRMLRDMTEASDIRTSSGPSTTD